MSIITKRGDEGETDLLFGRRVRKSDLRMEFMGAVDELNSALGLARVAGMSAELTALIDRIQEKLVAAMGLIATLPEDVERYRYATISSEDVAWLESIAKELEGRGVRYTDWARPGADGAMGSAALDLARAVARRAERHGWQLHEQGDEVSSEVRLFLNRLSDLLWIMARVEGKEHGEFLR